MCKHASNLLEELGILKDQSKSVEALLTTLMLSDINAVGEERVRTVLYSVADIAEQNIEHIDSMLSTLQEK
jgi:hypothetical protein